MYWTAKLRRALGFGRNSVLPTAFSGSAGKDRINDTLLENPAVRCDQTIVDRLILDGETVFFMKGDTIIQQGGQDSDVYFLLSGEVDIVFNSQRGSIREAPNQVGEMAAIELGKKRTASVVARSNEVATLRVPGTVFRELLATNQRFLQFLQIEMSARHRERIVAASVAKENYTVIWFLVSIAAGLVTALAASYFIVLPDWTTSARSMLSFGLGLAVFVVTLLHNPAFFWRRSFLLVLLAMIGTFALDRFVSIEATRGFGSLQFGIAVADGETDWKMDSIKAVLFLFVLLLCAYMDKLNTSD